MEPDLLQEFEDYLNQNVYLKIVTIKENISDVANRLEKYIDNITVPLKQTQYKNLISKLKTTTNTTKEIEIKIKKDIDKMIRNAVINAYKRDIAEINQFRINTLREPKSPKYISSIGTALIPSGGALFASLFFTTHNILIATSVLLILLALGISLLIWSVLEIRDYDKEVKDTHKKLLMDPFKIKTKMQIKKRI